MSVLFLVLIILNSCALSAIETDINYVPAEPAPLSNITFTAQITADNVTSVKIYVQECNPTFCFSDWIIETMSQVGPDEYQGEVKLTHSDATYLFYWLVIVADGTEHDLQEEKGTLNLKISETDGNGENNSPGFELIALIIGITLLAFIYKKKRLK
jgi:hypothetical protein